jgi:UPF0755 protein
MSLNKKIIIFCLLLLIGLPSAGLWYYKKTHPKYIPPPPRKEIEITIIPGWNIKNIAEDWVKKGLIKNVAELYKLVGEPGYIREEPMREVPLLPFIAQDPELKSLFESKPLPASYEGYFLPETYRVYADATSTEVLKKIFSTWNNKLTPEIIQEMKRQKKSFYEVLTLASVVEKEVANAEDRGMVADIFLRRLDSNWFIQSCATINYITGKNSPAASSEDIKIDSPYNTYMYKGLPPGPIGSPSIASVKAVLFPTKNKYWYFMAGTDGVTRFSRTLEEHNRNVDLYLR